MVLVERPDVVPSWTRKIRLGCGEGTSLFVTIGYQVFRDNDHQNPVVLPLEIFLRFGKNDLQCGTSMAETIARLISAGLRTCHTPEARLAFVNDVLFKQLVGINCPHPCGFGSNQVTSCADAIAKTFRLFMEERSSLSDVVQLQESA